MTPMRGNLGITLLAMAALLPWHAWQVGPGSDAVRMADDSACLLIADGQGMPGALVDPQMRSSGTNNGTALALVATSIGWQAGDPGHAQRSSAPVCTLAPRISTSALTLLCRFNV